MSTALPPFSAATMSSAAAATAAAIAASASPSSSPGGPISIGGSSTSNLSGASSLTLPTSAVATAAAAAAETSTTVSRPGKNSSNSNSKNSSNNNNSNGKSNNSATKKRKSPSRSSSASPTEHDDASSKDGYNDDTEPTSPSSGGNPKRPLNRVGKNGEPLSEKKIRRLEKNRLSARECRRRKREATEDLQRQINMLEGENLRLRLQLQVGEEAEVSNQEEQQKLTEGLDDLLRSGASESEIYAKIEEYKEKFADYGRDRRSAIEFHLRNIERLLQPTQTTSVVLTTLNMGQPLYSNTNTKSDPEATTESNTAPNATPPTTSTEEEKQEAATAPITPESIHSTTPTSDYPSSAASAQASSSSGFLSVPPPSNLDTKSLFKHLVKILQVTPEQAAALKDSRFVAKEMDECLKASLDVLKELRKRLTQCGQDLEQEFNNIRAILTPTQAAKFLVWVANNKACMHMLNELWDRVYPQMGSSNADDTNGSGSFDESGDVSP